MITYVKGDLLKADVDVIGHGVNCFVTMKSGIAKVIVRYFSKVQRADNIFMGGGISREKLGMVDFVEVDSKSIKIVANCYTQYRYGRRKRQLDYEALELCFEQLKEFIEKNN